MEQYKEYKDSGIPWIGQVPNHWKTYRFGTLCKIKSICDCVDEELLSVYLDRGVIRFSDDDNRRTNPTSKDLTKYQLVEPGDFVLNNQQAWRGSVGVSKYRGIVSPAYFIFSLSPKLNTDFANLMFRSRNYVANYYVCSKGIGSIQRNLDWGQLKQRSIFLPPFHEQEKIVNYLERKTSSIDAYVAEKEKELQLLNELKEAEIANVVTQGLNPDVKMKESRTPFFGLIPEHWEERKMKYCFSERSEKNHPEEPILCATQSQGVIPQSMYQNRVVVVNKGFEGLKFVKVGDFVISLRSFEGGIEYAYYQGIISAAYTILTPNNSDNADYFKLLFKSYPFIQVLQTCVTGIREGQNINYQMLGRQFIPMPPIDEQRAIVTYVEDKCAKVNTLIAELEAEIEYMKEYKQRLIADCVTGQVNVQNVNNKTNVI